MSLAPPETLHKLRLDAESRDCTFCQIAHHYPLIAPTDPASYTSPTLPAHIPESHLVLSTTEVIAFLDILPLSPCHILVCPRSHYEKLTDLPSSINASIGAWLPIIAKAACHVSGYADFNVVQNNGVNAAQVVPHVHYHIIPRPDERQREELEKKVPGEFKKWWKSPFGSGWRVELDDEEAREMVGKLRIEVGRLVELEKKRDGRSLL
ncbi:HIT-like domain-containing protein [Pyronema omphalodes]|nr:HIT-like domain-containing protein [Pyronema omphalodes]